jgi:hypothetical protein
MNNRIRPTKSSDDPNIALILVNVWKHSCGAEYIQRWSNCGSGYVIANARHTPHHLPESMLIPFLISA